MNNQHPHKKGKDVFILAFLLGTKWTVLPSNKWTGADLA